MSRHERRSGTASLQSSRHRQASVRIASLVGYRTAADKERFEAFIRRGIRLRLYQADDPTTTQLADNNDDNLFSSLLTNGHHVLKQLLPDRTNYQ